jgi:hypothetical protein
MDLGNRKGFRRKKGFRRTRKKDLGEIRNEQGEI